MKKQLKIWTIGTSNRSLEEFLHLLEAHQIEVIVDVRRFPTSKLKHFKRENLEANLNRARIQYFHVTELGGYRKGGYKEYMKSEQFKNGLLFVEKIASTKKVALMCAEKLFFRCHRRYIAEALRQRGYEIIHIVDEKRSFEHKTLGDF
jgi:uncharacterized protein (DUF488 family)